MVSRTTALNRASFAVEVEVDRAFGDAGTARHVGELGGREAALHEHVERGGHDLPGRASLRRFQRGFAWRFDGVTAWLTADRSSLRISY